MQTRKDSVRRRPVQVSPAVETSRGHSQQPSVSDIDSHSDGSPRPGNGQLLQIPTWDAVSQISTAPATANTSSVGSPALGHARTASYSTAATAPSLIDSGRVKKLAPLHEHLDIIRTYKPGRAATELWTVSTSHFGGNAGDAGSKESPGEDERDNSWNFWERMVNTADALAAAKYLNDAFDLHHICFLEIFNDTGNRLSHLDSAAPVAGNHGRDQKASKLIASSLPLLQLLNRAVIGAARSCTTPANSKLARVMLDAAHCVLRHIKNPTQVRALLILFDIYRNTLIELWHHPNTPDTAKPSNYCESSPTSPKSSRLNQEYSLDDLVMYIPTAILSREYFVLSTHLLNLSRYQRSWLSLPARSTAWERPLAEFVRNLAIPSKSSQGWLRLVTGPAPYESNDFIEAYLRETKAFLLWSTNTVFEGRAILEASLADQPQSSHVVARDFLNDARLALYWFLVSRRKSLDFQTTGINYSAARCLPKFPHSDNSPATFDAFWILSSFVFGFCTPGPLPTPFRSVSEYALAKLGQIMKWPHGFVWYYLRQTVSLASRLYSDGDFVQDGIERKYIDLAILGTDPTSTPDIGVQVAAELHPQPLPEFIDSPNSNHSMSPIKPTKSHTRSTSRVTFAESPDTYSPPTKSPRRRWLQRLSLSSTSSGSISMPGFKSSTTKSKANSPRSSIGDRSSRQSADSTIASGGLNKLDDFPGDYAAITADLLESTSSFQEINGIPPTPPPEPTVTVKSPQLDADKMGSVVQSTEIHVPESRPPFIVLH